MGKHSASNGFGPFGRGDSDEPRGRKRPVKRATQARRGAPLPKQTRSRMPEETYSLSDAASRRKGALETAPARLRIERERRRERTKRMLLIGAAVVAAVLLIGVAGVYAYAKHLESTMTKTIHKQEKVIASLEKAKPQEPFTILLVGEDKRPGEKVARTDTMLLGRIDPQTKQVWLLSIPRDTKVTIPGHGTQKINNAFVLGGEELAIKTIEKFTGVPINHFMSVDFNGFRKAVDAMGGVWVDVPTEIDDPKADGSPFRNSSHIDPGYQLLDGNHALTFVRSRDYADADISRMKNQQAFFKAIADQIAKRTSVTKIPRIVSGMAPYISTDMSLMDMLRAAQALRGAGSSNVYTATIGGEWHSPYLITDEENKADLLAKFKAGEPFEKPASETTTTPAATSTTTQDRALPDPADVTLTIRNGAGIAGCAKQASSILKARAFQVVETGNANQFVYDQTLVVYKSDRKAAEQVAKALPPSCKLVESRGMYSFNTDVLVVIGKDWDVSKVPVAPIKTN